MGGALLIGDVSSRLIGATFGGYLVGHRAGDVREGPPFPKSFSSKVNCPEEGTGSVQARDRSATRQQFLSAGHGGSRDAPETSDGIGAHRPLRPSLFVSHVT